MKDFNVCLNNYFKSIHEKQKIGEFSVYLKRDVECSEVDGRYVDFVNLPLFGTV